MSEFVSVEWFGRKDKIGIVLTYDEHDGFKARMAPLASNNISGLGDGEDADIQFLMEQAAKIPFEWAWGIFGKRMKTEWLRHHLADKQWPTVRYDHQDYDILEKIN